MENVTFKCSATIPTHKGPSDTLTLKPIKAGSIVKHGYPTIETIEGFGTGRKLTVGVNWSAVIKITADCCDEVDSLVLEANLPAADMMPLYQTLMGMLVPTPSEIGPA